MAKDRGTLSNLYNLTRLSCTPSLELNSLDHRLPTLRTEKVAAPIRLARFLEN